MVKRYYYTLAKCAFDDFENEHIKISRLGLVNDPNEWTPIFYDPDTQEKVPVEFARKFVREHWSDSYGFVSLSKSWDIAPMWGLYSDKYRGVVLELEILREDLLFTVDYRNERPQCSISGGEEELRKIVATKSDGWRFEQEVRYLCSLDINNCQHLNGICFGPMQVISPSCACNIRLLRVILGPMIDMRWRNKFLQLSMEYEKVPVYGRKIPLVSTVLDNETYSIRFVNDLR